MPIFTLPRALRTATFISAVFTAIVGLASLATAAPTGQPVAYAITPNNTITVIDTGNHQVLGSIALGGPVGYVAATPDGRQLYAAGGSAVVWVIDTQTRTVVQSIPLPEENQAFGMVMSADGTRLYVSTGLYDQTDSIVLAIDTATNTVVASIFDSEQGADGIAISPDGTRVYVPMTDGLPGYGALDVIDTASNQVIGGLRVGIPVNVFSWAAVSPDSSKVYAAAYWCCDPDGAGIAVYDKASNALLKTLPGVATLQVPLPNTSILYGTAGGTVVAFDTLTDTVAHTVSVADSVNNIALTPDHKQLYVSSAQAIAILDTATNTVTGSFALAGATALTITAAPPPASQPPTVRLSVAPNPVYQGRAATLSWVSTGATSCVPSGDLPGPVQPQGSIVVSYGTSGTHNYSLTCTGAGGTASGATTLKVLPGPALTLSASDIPVTGTATLSWKAAPGETACSASGDWSGTQPTSGSTTVGPLPVGTYRFQLDCTAGADVIATAVQTLTVFTPGELPYQSLGHASDNVAAFYWPTPPLPAGLDGHGWAFNLIYTPQPIRALGQAFTLADPSLPSGVTGKTLPLGNVPLLNLTLLATGVNGNQPDQPFVVTYGDGSTVTYTQSLSDWAHPQQYPGEIVAQTLPFRMARDGSAQNGKYSMYAYRITLDSSKVAVSLRLPGNRNVVVLAINETLATRSTQVALGSAFNVYGLASVGQVAVNGRLDGHGYGYDASLVPTGLTVSGQQFSIGAADQPDAVANATLALPPRNTLSVTVLAAAVNGAQANQTFVVTYQDGNTSSFRQNLSDWHQPQSAPGEALARSTGFRVTPAGVLQSGVWDLYAYTFQTDASRPVKSLTLPRNRNVVVLAVNTQAQ